jgi:hypothetical protein
VYEELKIDDVELFVSDYDQPLVVDSAGNQKRDTDQFMPDADAVAMIEGMGFTRQQATVALKATVRIRLYLALHTIKYGYIA